MKRVQVYEKSQVGRVAHPNISTLHRDSLLRQIFKVYELFARCSTVPSTSLAGHRSSMHPMKGISRDIPIFYWSALPSRFSSM